MTILFNTHSPTGRRTLYDSLLPSLGFSSLPSVKQG